MTEKEETFTTIKVSRKNHARIAAFGNAGESMNTALSKLLDFAELGITEDNIR